MWPFKKKKSDIRRPGLFWFATESGRAIAEYSISIPYRKFYPEASGDGHPVLILPGFLSSDTSTNPLRSFLERIGYQAYGWELGRNYANNDQIDKILDRLDEIYEEHQEPVSVIGWSLGGIYARQIAKDRPQQVRQVITLGSPFRAVTSPNNVAWIYNLINGGKLGRKIDQELLEDLPVPPPVPTTAIYSKEDGIVPWKACMEAEETPTRQNIQVHGSHFGLGVNPAVLRIIANRLRYTKADWIPFTAPNIVEDMLAYPSL